MWEITMATWRWPDSESGWEIETVERINDSETSIIVVDMWSCESEYSVVS